ncbi:Mth938-like domain-containing protein [Allosphingosinicella sp.]|uniref:Mth938-like domain-containing protein n=1 Tax=Allosphingosinicella sp. TaxID=2823234 RepID=UPI003783397A
MKAERTPAGYGPLVQGFAGRAFRVSGATYDAVLLTPEAAMGWIAPALDALTEAELAPLLAVSPPPEFILLGTGPALQRPPPALVAALDAGGIGVEAMDSRAAARTWGLLRGEGRWIAAALLPL